MDRTYTDTIIMPRETMPTASASPPRSHKLKTLHDYANEFLAEVLNKNTLKAYAQDIRHFLSTVGNDLSDESLLVYREFTISDSSPRTARRRLGVVKSFLDSLVLKDVLVRNLYSHIKMLSPRVDKNDSPTCALEDAEVRRMIEHASNHQLIAEAAKDLPNIRLGASRKLTFVLSFHLGLRVSELTHIKLGDIKGNVLTIIGKGNKKRVLELDETVMDEISGYIVTFDRSEPGSYLIRCQKTKDGSMPVNTETINGWFQDVAKAVGIEKHVTPHVGRATAITKLLDEGVPLRDVGRFAGHASMDTTLIYDKKKRQVPTAVLKKVRY